MLSVEQLIPTVNGVTPLKYITTDDFVFSEKGNPVKVARLGTILTPTDTYEIRLDTGEVILADSSQLWKTFDEKERNQLLRLSDNFRIRRKAERPSRALKNPKKISSQINITKSNQLRSYEYLPIPTGSSRSTLELFSTLLTRRGRYNHTISSIKTTDLPAKEVTTDPYVLGLWLGDGSIRSGEISMTISDFEEAISTTNEEIKSYYAPKDRNVPFATYRLIGLKNKLKQLRILDNKRIPAEYLRGSYEQRLALLQGLMDTDGTCDIRGKCEVGFSKKDLSEDVLELICSLGFKSSLRVKRLSLKNPKHNDHFRMSFSTDVPVFRLERKARLQKSKSSKKAFHRTVVSIRSVEPVAMRSIQVDSPDGIVLIGRTYIPIYSSINI